MSIPTLRRLAFLIFCILSVGLACVSRAEDEKIPEIKTASGKTYRDVRVTKVTPSEISIMHESGAGRIPLKDLPDDLKAKFGYDPARAMEFKKQADAKEAQNQAAANQAALYQKRLKSAEPRRFKVSNVIKGEKGVLAKFYYPGGVAGSAARAMGTSVVESSEGELVFLIGKLYSNLVDGAYIEATCFENGIYEYTTTAGSTSTVKKFEVVGMILLSSGR